MCENLPDFDAYNVAHRLLFSYLAWVPVAL
jgi:hypothetical protein